VGTGDVFLALKPPGCKDDHSVPASAKAMNEWSNTCAPPYAFLPCIGISLLPLLK